MLPHRQSPPHRRARLAQAFDAARSIGARRPADGGPTEGTRDSYGFPYPCTAPHHARQPHGRQRSRRGQAFAAVRGARSGDPPAGTLAFGRASAPEAGSWSASTDCASRRPGGGVRSARHGSRGREAGPCRREPPQLPATPRPRRGVGVTIARSSAETVLGTVAGGLTQGPRPRGRSRRTAAASAESSGEHGRRDPRIPASSSTSGWKSRSEAAGRREARRGRMNTKAGRTVLAVLAISGWLHNGRSPIARP